MLSASAPTFACVGNHDGGSWASPLGGYADFNIMKNILDNSGIRLLHNQSHAMALKGRDLTFVGVGDLWSGEVVPAKAFADIPPEARGKTIVLAHNPDSKTNLKPYSWDLLLCGHTHGGQIELPIIGTPFAPVRDRRFVSGLHEWNKRWIYITKGIGNLFGVRFNCCPEVSILNLV